MKFDYKYNLIKFNITVILLLLTIGVFGQDSITRSYADIKDAGLRNFVSRFQQITSMPSQINASMEENELIEEDKEYLVMVREPELPDYDSYYYGNSIFYKDFFAIFSIHSVSFRTNYEKQEIQLQTFNYEGKLIDSGIIGYSEYTRDNQDNYTIIEKAEITGNEITIEYRYEVLTYEDGGEALMHVDVGYTTDTTYDSCSYELTKDGYIIHTDIEYAKRYFNFKEDPLECRFKLFYGNDGEEIVAAIRLNKKEFLDVKERSEILYNGYSFSYKEMINSWLPSPIYNMFNPIEKEYPVRYNCPIYKGDSIQKGSVNGKFLIIEDWIFFYGYLDY